jgi:hypothetical protein
MGLNLAIFGYPLFDSTTAPYKMFDNYRKSEYTKKCKLCNKLDTKEGVPKNCIVMIFEILYAR